jgi:hypothetical protein
MSRDEAHGGGSWAFGRSLWSPSRKTNGTRWAFWETLLRVEAGDPVLHLRGKGDRATFVAFSTSAAGGFETGDRPPNPGAWGYTRSYYRVTLRDFTPLADPMLLRDVFRRRDTELRSYFTGNRTASRKERLFYVIQGVSGSSPLVGSRFGLPTPNIRSKRNLRSRGAGCLTPLSS